MPARSHLPYTYLYNTEFSWILLIRSFELRHLEQIVSFFLQDLEALPLLSRSFIDLFISSTIDHEESRNNELFFFFFDIIILNTYKSVMQKYFKIMSC